MPNKNEHILELVSLIYDAAWDSSQWVAVLNRLAKVLDCHIIHLGSIGARTSIPASIGLSGSDERALSEYYWRVNPWVACGETVIAPAIAPSHHIVPDTTYRATEYFNDFGRRIEQYYGLGGVISKSDSVLYTIGGLRDKRAGPCTDKDAEFLLRLMPHMARALKINTSVAKLESQVESLLDCLDRMGRGVVILNARSELVRMNRVAESIAAQRDGINISVGAGLRADLSAETATLQRMIRGAALMASEEGGVCGGTVSVSRRSGRRPWIAVVSPYRNASGESFAVVLLIDPEGESEPSAEVVARLFGFTPSETKLALLLARGIRLEESSHELRITLNTARTHVRHMLEKTQLRRQTDLVILLNRLPTVERM